MISHKKKLLAFSLLIFFENSASAAISLDRTRVIFDGSLKSLSLNVSNDNKQLPYLAQGWIEDAAGVKITSPLVVLPPVQRIEAGAKSQLKIQGMPELKNLPQDRESLFYFNLREIPPRSDKPNTLQIALQTRVKLFYRPESISLTKSEMSTPWQEKIKLDSKNGEYQVTNPTPYYLTIIDVTSKNKVKDTKFRPIMIEPMSSKSLGISPTTIGMMPIVTYINDYGGKPDLAFNCNGNECVFVPKK